jgi:HEAT repeat protein
VKTSSTLLALAFGLGLLTGAVGAEFTSAEFNQATEPLKAYTYGKPQPDLEKIERWVALASPDAKLRVAVEQRLLELLAQASSRDARQFLCRQLRTIGTSASVRPLEQLLTDPELSHLARYALGRIEVPQAGEALRRALRKTSGELQVGILHTLAQRQETKALPDIAGLLNSPDTQVVTAATRALGRLGDGSSVSRLRKARSAASPGLRAEIDHALLSCAERFLTSGKEADAVKIYEGFHRAAEPLHLRIAGLRGLAAARKSQAAALIVADIRGGDAALRPHAIALLSETPGPAATAALIALSQSMPGEAQEGLLRALAQRGDPSAIPSMIAAAAHPEVRTRIAACEALAEIGGPAAVPVLARIAGSASGAEQQSARAGLIRVDAAGIAEAFKRALGEGHAKARAEVARAVGQRNLHDAFRDLYQLASGDPDNGVRMEAITALGRVAQAQDLVLLLNLIVRPKSADDRPSIAEAVTQVLYAGADRRAQAQLVIAAFDAAPAEAKPALLGLLAQPATEDALRTVRQAVSDADAAVSEAATRALGEWPNADPADDLFRLATTSSTPKARALALRGCVRLAGLSEDPTALYVKAMGLAQTDEERKLVLGGLSNADTLVALELAERQRSRPELEAEASLAAVRIAAQYGWSDPARGTPALTLLATEARQEFVRKEAQAALKRMAEMKDFIVVWRGAGPFQLEGVNDGGAVFRNLFPPEQEPGSAAVKWRPIKAVFEGDKRLNLEATYGAMDFCCAYLRTTVWSPAAQDLKLVWAVDDYIKGWLNGRPVQEGTVSLKEGANVLLLKVGDHGGEWNFNCRLTKPDGTAPQGLRFEAQ